jgi:hypothetical protein
MSDFVPRHIPTPYHFDIRHDRQGHWIARDRDGLTGGIFLTCKDAVRFALFETGGDSAHVHVLPDYPAPRSPISRRQKPPGHSISSTAR